MASSAAIIVTSLDEVRRERARTNDILAPLGDVADLNDDTLRRMLEASEEGFMSDSFTAKDYIDARADAVRAENESRFSDVLSEIKGLKSLVESKPSTWQMVGAIFGAAATILGVLLAALAFGGDRFDGGLGMAEQRQEQIQRDTDQDAIIKRLDALLSQSTTREPQEGTMSVE